jgi:hypothetical protein
MIDYKFSKPSNCSNCGSDLRQPSVSFSSNSKPVEVQDPKGFKGEPKKHSRLLRAQETIDQLDDQDSDTYVFEGEIPQIRPGQGIKIEIPRESQSVTFGQIFENPSKPSKDFVFTEDNSEAEEKVLEKLKKESSNTREVFDVN